MITQTSTQIKGTDLFQAGISVLSQESQKHPALIQLSLQYVGDVGITIGTSTPQLRNGAPPPFDTLEAVDAPIPTHLIPTHEEFQIRLLPKRREHEDENQESRNPNLPLYERKSLTGRDSNCWILTTQYGRPDILSESSIGPGEIQESRYALVTEPHAREGFPAGEYRFESSFMVMDGQEDREWIVKIEMG